MSEYLVLEAEALLLGEPTFHDKFQNLANKVAKGSDAPDARHSIEGALAYLREHKWVLDCGVKEITQVQKRPWPRRPIRRVTAFEVWYKWSADEQWHMVKYALQKGAE